MNADGPSSDGRMRGALDDAAHAWWMGCSETDIAAHLSLLAMHHVNEQMAILNVVGGAVGAHGVRLQAYVWRTPFGRDGAPSAMDAAHRAVVHAALHAPAWLLIECGCGRCVPPRCAEHEDCEGDAEMGELCWSARHHRGR